jgi:hypothetical protein
VESGRCRCWTGDGLAFGGQTANPSKPVLSNTRIKDTRTDDTHPSKRNHPSLNKRSLDWPFLLSEIRFLFTSSLGVVNLVFAVEFSLKMIARDQSDWPIVFYFVSYAMICES